jgi:hypothetical protein
MQSRKYQDSGTSMAAPRWMESRGANGLHAFHKGDG